VAHKLHTPIQKLKNESAHALLDTKHYTLKHQDNLRELGSRLTPASDGKPRQFLSKRCVNLISELLDYREDVKENDNATDALRYSLPLVQEEKTRFCM
jgi:hypothetical protein